MKLALVHKRYDQLGGAEWDCYEMSCRLARRGHEVHLVTGECRVPVPDGILVHRVPVLRTGQLAKLLSFAALAPRVWRRVDADVVVGFGRTVGHDLFRASGGCHREYLTRVAVERGGWTARRQQLSPYHRAMLAIERRQYGPGGYRKILAVSALSRQEILATYPTVAAEDVAVLHYGVDVERFHPRRRSTEGTAVRRELGVAIDRPLVLFVGTGFRRKGVDTLLEIWRRDPPRGATLVVVGNDQHLASYQRAARSSGGRVVFTGPRRDVDRLCAAADLFALPSLYEGCPVAILEALASGLPVVTSRATGAPELLVGPLAELTVDDPRDVKAIGEALRAGLEPRRREELALAARAAGCAVGLDEVVTQLETWCARVAAEKGHRVA